MKDKLINIIRRMPGGNRSLQAYMHLKRTILFSRLGHPREVFTHIYRTNSWGNQESISGHGSSTEYTENIRKELPVLFKSLNIRSVLDAPCGDYNWFRLIRKDHEINYLGGDIVGELIRYNQAHYLDSSTSFTELDIIHEKLPAAELWLLRDCLFHFSYQDIFATLDNFIQSDLRYLLTTTHGECHKNRNITTGDFRLINLELPPFNLRVPDMKIADWIEGYPVRYLGLWKREEVSEDLKRNPEFKKWKERNAG